MNKQQIQQAIDTYVKGQVNAMIELTGGKYSLRLSKTPGQSELMFIPN